MRHAYDLLSDSDQQADFVTTGKKHKTYKECTLIAIKDTCGGQYSPLSQVSISDQAIMTVTASNPPPGIQSDPALPA